MAFHGWLPSPLPPWPWYELTARFGHGTPAAATRYQHAAQGRDTVIAASLSAFVGTAEDHTGAETVTQLVHRSARISAR